MRNKNLSTTLSYAPAVLLPALSNVFFVAIYTRLVSQGMMGQYFRAIAYVAFFPVVLVGWYQQGILRYKSGLPMKDFGNDLFYGIFLISLAIMVFFLAWMAGQAFDSLVVILLIGTESFNRLALSILQATKNASKYAIFTIGTALGKLVFPYIFFLIYGSSINILLFGCLFASVLSVVIEFFIVFMATRTHFMRVNMHQFHLLFNTQVIRDYLAYGIPVSGFLLLSAVRPIIDREIIGTYLGVDAIGVYSIFYAIGANAIGVINTPIMLAAHPALMELANKGEKAYLEKTSTLYASTYLIISVIIILAVIPNTDFIARLLTKEQYFYGNKVISITVIGSVISGLASYYGKGIEVSKKTHQMLFANVVSVFIGVVGSFFLIKTNGVLGVAISYAIGSLVYLLIVSILSSRYLKIKLLPITYITAGSLTAFSYFVPIIFGTNICYRVVAFFLFTLFFLFLASKENKWIRDLIVLHRNRKKIEA